MATKTQQLQKLVDKYYGKSEQTVSYNSKTKTYWCRGNWNQQGRELGDFDEAKQTLEDAIHHVESVERENQERLKGFVSCEDENERYRAIEKELHASRK